LDRYGDSPLEKAISNNKTDAAKLLIQHGAQKIRGSEEQRDNASREMVDEDIREMDADAKKYFMEHQK
jgi:ankyrin repeat protein